MSAQRVKVLGGTLVRELNDKGHSGTIFCFAPVRTVGMPSLVARCSLNSLGAVLYKSARSIVAECQRFFVGKITMQDNAVNAATNLNCCRSAVCRVFI